MHLQMNPAAEWLEADGLGGFASGTVAGYRTRRYHALLLTATTPPTGRFVLVNGVEAWVETPIGRFALSTQRYTPDVLHADGHSRIESFSADPWPTWVYRLEDGTRIEQELFVPHGASCVALRWRLLDRIADAALYVRPLMSGRDYHSLQRENAAFRFEPVRDDVALTWRPYDGVPATVTVSNAEYVHDPLWYRSFLYTEERDRGLDCVEDLASPGVFGCRLDESECVLILATEEARASIASGPDAATVFADLRISEQRHRQQLDGGPLDRAAESYIVQRGEGRTIIAGYPWFTDWGRDTFIALRGLCLSRDQLDVARDILLDWAKTVSEGMLPNRFPDNGEEPEFNSVDASLWYVIAVDEYLQRIGTSRQGRKKQSGGSESALRDAVMQILNGYHRGTRFGIRCDSDGLLACGTPGVQLTWMDAKVGDWVVTPRIGKPVEVQALWLNALAIGARYDEKWQPVYDRGLESFRQLFWNEADRCLFDVVDNDHHPGTFDAAIRPNQILAVGGLPFPLLPPEQARAVVETVESQLLTPVGLRSLTPTSPNYVPHYVGGVRERDGAYHQGTVWPWLMGPFVEAWVRVRGNTNTAKREARARFVETLLDRLNDAGIGHIAEIADAEVPHTFRGCPFQAWSVGEVIRLCNDVLKEAKEPETSGVATHPKDVSLCRT